MSPHFACQLPDKCATRPARFLSLLIEHPADRIGLVPAAKRTIVDAQVHTTGQMISEIVAAL
jgi:hypothetical protein